MKISILNGFLPLRARCAGIGIAALIMVLAIGCASTPDKAATDALSVHKMYHDEILNERKFELAQELLAPDYVKHSPGYPDASGPEGFLAMMMPFYDAFPDIHFTYEDRFASGHKVAIRWSLTGTHKGDLGDIPATGKKVKMIGLSIHYIKDGKFIESWDYGDLMGLMQQLAGE